MKKGFILEDLKDAQAWLSESLSKSFPGINIVIAESIEEAKEILTSYRPDLALIDLSLPDGSGITILNFLSTEQPECIPVVTTIYDDDESLFAALCAGAQGYLLKEQRKHELVSALQGITEGMPALSPKISIRILDYFKSTSNNKIQSVMDKSVTDKEELSEQLTQRETDVLGVLAKGLSSKEAASELNISYHTVVSHIKNIYSKLNISSRAEITQEAIRLGMLDT